VTTPSSMQYIKSGQLRAIAVTTAKRMPELPDLPAISEFVPGYNASAWYGLGAPKDTPKDIINKLNREINAAVADASIKKRFDDLGCTIIAGSPADLGKLIADDTERWAKVVRFAGLKAD
jgi:tripartite-type tricarboxylate transporter receptor subunit TctC